LALGTAGRARVPDVALYATRKRLEPPAHAEGFDRLFRVRTGGAGRWQVEALPLPEPGVPGVNSQRQADAGRL
jgi:hypothetical protein